MKKLQLKWKRFKKRFSWDKTYRVIRYRKNKEIEYSIQFHSQQYCGPWVCFSQEDIYQNEVYYSRMLLIIDPKHWFEKKRPIKNCPGCGEEPNRCTYCDPLDYGE